jgi:hypothetical protein
MNVVRVQPRHPHAPPLAKTPKYVVALDWHIALVDLIGIFGGHQLLIPASGSRRHRPARHMPPPHLLGLADNEFVKPLPLD